jgi:hypothetical protein
LVSRGAVVSREADHYDSFNCLLGPLSDFGGADRGDSTLQRANPLGTVPLDCLSEQTLLIVEVGVKDRFGYTCSSGQYLSGGRAQSSLRKFRSCPTQQLITPVARGQAILLAKADHCRGILHHD